jgi:Cu+-exporting ATPase
MENVQWKVEGMDCTNCALTIRRYLEKEGMKNVKVNFGTGDVSFDMNESIPEIKLSKGIKKLGYEVVDEKTTNIKPHPASGGINLKLFPSTHLQRFLFCLPFTVVLMLPMIPRVHIHWLMDPWVQLGLTIPVFLAGMSFFGKSAWKSLRNGIPNMNVLITMGAAASFIYSLYGTLTNQAAHFMFYETTVTIITLVFLGNYLEEASVRSTQKALNVLIKSQKVMANMIAFDDEHKEQVFPVENTDLRVGDLVLIKSGEQVPMDCKILWGDAHVNESIITGESSPVHKYAKDKLIGGSMLNDGTVKAQVIAVGKDTILSGIINLVKQAQGEKPPVQQLADKISAIFVPVVLGIAAITLVINWIVLNDFTHSLMRSIAVLVIACPCAMGLATPAAIAVGLGRGARNGILFRNALSLELFKDIKQAVFDKTGTLTTGKFKVSGFRFNVGDDSDFKRIVYSLEKYSNHPIAKCITDEWKNSTGSGIASGKPMATEGGKEEIRWAKIEEVKGLGMKATDKEGNNWSAGSYKTASAFTTDDTHNVYIIKNNTLIGWIDVKDEIRPEAKSVIDYLHTKGIRTILLSGDRFDKTKALADQLGIDTVIAEQSPEQKLLKVAELSSAFPTVMIGDGINDAPALAKATVGISMSDASQIAVQTSQVVLMSNGLKNLPTALGLGKHTYITIKQNLFWAFAYNIIAIPIAALGFLTPNFSALAMGLSDVVLAINSVRLFVKKVI